MRRVVPWLLAGLGGTLVVAGLAVVLGSAAEPTGLLGWLAGRRSARHPAA